MSVRSFRRSFVTALVVSLMVLPLSSAQAAPADRVVVRSLNQTVAQALHKLMSAFRLFPQDAPSGNHPGNNHPSGESREGTGIDPHGKPGPGN
jgi:hypothetical protein